MRACASFPAAVLGRRGDAAKPLQGAHLGDGQWQDAATPTGGRVVYPPAALPVDRSGATISADVWSRFDGFSPATAMLAYMANVSVEASGLPGWQDYAASLADDAPTVLLDTANLVRLAHFAELDYSSDSPVRRPRPIPPLWP